MNEVLIVAGVYGAFWLLLNWIDRGGYERADRSAMIFGIGAWSIAALVALLMIVDFILF